MGFNKNNSKVTRRIIPDLPAQMMFVSEAIARSRITRLQEYINVSYSIIYNYIIILII